MKRVLSALYGGELDPAAQHRPQLEAYLALHRQHEQHYARFLDGLSEMQRMAFNRLMDEQLEALPFELEESFTDGFRLGVRLMAEVYGRWDC